MPKKRSHEYQLIGEKRHSQSRSIMNVFLGILLFVAIFFPFFVINYKYQIGSFLSTLLDGIGKFSLMVGGLYMLLGVLGLFTRSHNWIKHLIYGVILLWIGCWCTGTVLDIMGINFGSIE